MVTQNKTWRFSKRIKNDNYNVWRKSTSQHFDLGAVISSPPLPLPDSDSAGCIDGRGSFQEWWYYCAEVEVLRSALPPYIIVIIFYPLRKSPRFILCHHTYSCNYSLGMGDILHAICMRISSVKPVPWLALNLHHLFSNGAVFNTRSRSSQTSYAYIDWYITFDMNTILRSLSVIYGSVY